MNSHLLIRLQSYEISENSSTSDQYVYFSFSFDLNNLYFSSCIDMNQKARITLNDHIIIPLQRQSQDSTTLQLPNYIDLQRWQNHMIMLVHSINISDLQSRVSIRKRYETRSGQILSFMITLLNQGDIQFGYKYIQSISQHYLTIDTFKLMKNPQRKRIQGDQLSYFIIKSSACEYVMPVMSGQVCIKLPETLQFIHRVSNSIVSKSKVYKSDQLRQQSLKIVLNAQTDGFPEQLQVRLRWGINLQQQKPENTILLDSHEILCYDIQLKLQRTQQLVNCRLKLIYGNKVFQMHNFEGNTTKQIKIKKIVFFIIKSQDQEFDIVLESNFKIISLIKIFTQDISMFGVINLRRKFYSKAIVGSTIGVIKFKCEKGKNLSVPSNNKYWRECLNSKRKILSNSILLSFQQLSVKNRKHEAVNLSIKNQTEQRVLQNVPNFQFFNPDQQALSVPQIFTVRQQQSVYIIMKPADDSDYAQQEYNEEQFIGIALLNFNQLKLGMNSVQVPFFLNHKIVGILHCLINKIVPYPFIKSSFQEQIPQFNRYLSKKNAMLIKMGAVKLNQYYYTYQYDNKKQLYCIVESNRIKKVLILKNQQSRLINYGDRKLCFMVSANSDNLNFAIGQSELIKIKITFLVSDLGCDEEIYGSVMVKIKASDLFPDRAESSIQDKNMNNGLKKNPNMHINAEGHLQFTKIQLTNDYGTIVGQISFNIQKGQWDPNDKQEPTRQRIQQYSSKRNVQQHLQYKYEAYPTTQSHQELSSEPFKKQINRVKNKRVVAYQKVDVGPYQKSPKLTYSKLSQSINRYDNQLYLPKKNQNIQSKQKPIRKRQISINPIRKAILNQSIDITKDVRYNSLEPRRNSMVPKKKKLKLPSLSLISNERI